MNFRKSLVNLFPIGLSACLVVGCVTQPRSTSEPLADAGSSLAPREPSTHTSPTRALPEDPQLVDYLRYAAHNNPGLEAAFYRWKAALEKVPQVRALPDPRFNYGYFVEQVETRVGPQRQRFGISQTFPWFGKLRLRGNQAGEAAIVAQMGYDQARLQLYMEVKRAYFELAYLRQAIELTRENIELVQHLENVAQARFRTGSEVSGVVKAQVELGQLEDRLHTLRDLRAPLTAQLNAALNRALEAPVPWPREVAVRRVEIDDEALVQQVIATNPELAELDAQIRASAHGIDLARKAFYPDLTLGVDYVETRDAPLAGVADSGKDPVMVMGSINLPLWLGKNRAGLREAEARLSSANKSRENRENGLLADLKMAIYRFREAERKISLFGDTLTPLAKNSLDVSEQAYQAGGADFLQLIDAQRLLLDVQLSYQRAIADREQRLAQIEMIVGAELQDSTAPTNTED